jgi:hypothetical protein
MTPEAHREFCAFVAAKLIEDELARLDAALLESGEEGAFSVD